MGLSVKAACQNGRVFVQGKGKLRHTFTTGGRVGADTAGIVRNVEVSGTSENTAAGHFDTHADSQAIVFRNCNAVSAAKDPIDTLDTSPSASLIQTRSRDTIIADCSSINAKGMGLVIGEDAHNTTITGCRISRVKRNADATKGYAIEFTGAVTGCTITGNSFTDLQTDVPSIIMVAGCHDTTITGNGFVNCGPIQAASSNDLVISGNRMKMGSGIKAINMTGTCDRWVIVGNNAQGSATSTFVGANIVKASNVNL